LRQPGTNPRACRATDSANQEPGFLLGALGQEFFFFLLVAAAFSQLAGYPADGVELPGI
jgi:hypothetical protein